MQGISSIVNEKWSKKYKRSIDCNHPKGFSQKAHCAGKRKHNESIEMEMVCEYCGMCKTHGNLNEIKKGQRDSNGYTKCWSGYHAQGTKKSSTTGKRVRNCVPNESVDEAANAAQQAAIAIAKKKKKGVEESIRKSDIGVTSARTRVAPMTLNMVAQQHQYEKELEKIKATQPKTSTSKRQNQPGLFFGNKDIPEIKVEHWINTKDKIWAVVELAKMFTRNHPKSLIKKVLADDDFQREALRFWNMAAERLKRKKEYYVKPIDTATFGYNFAYSGDQRTPMNDKTQYEITGNLDDIVKKYRAEYNIDKTGRQLPGGIPPHLRDTMGEGEVIKGPWSDKPKLRVVSNTPDINDIDQMTRGFMKSKLMPPSLDNRTNREILNKVIIYIFETFPDAYKTMTDNQTYAIAKKITDKVLQNSMNTRESSVIKGIVDEVSDTRTGTRKTGDLITGEHDSAYQRLKVMAPKLYDYIRNQAPVPVDPVMTLQFLQSMRGNQDAALARMKSELEKDTERMYGREYPVNEMPDTAGPVGTQLGGWRKMESSIMKGINGRK
jgi:hypothetical protein